MTFSFFLFLLSHPLLTLGLLNKQAYYIQTDEGPNRFFQFSSGPGGQFRKETILPNGTVVGVYSWKDGFGRTRLYSYLADINGYRVTQHDIRQSNKNREHDPSDSEVSDDVDNDLLGNSLDDEDISFRSTLRNSKNLRLRRKVLVKKQRSGRPRPDVRVRKLGVATKIIPYQPTLLLSNQYPGRDDQMRLVGEDRIVTINLDKNNNDNDKTETDEGISETETQAALPTSVLLQRIKVQPANQSQLKSNNRRQRGRMVKRRRKKKVETAVNRGDDNDDLHETDNVYFAPL